ncbi:uncharacterized protein LOC143234316 [Tachypleus tridentatus]|uniref:uncharacterized protein LOC143234316 n=1 Tax=Tachypleus tridentatus TaxID=6853 RepID=UPI003FD228E8
MCFQTVSIFQIVVSIALLSAGKSSMLTCVCTTSHCKSQHTNVCNTISMCYTQFLDKKDGSDPLVRGCITTKTPLLCENRRPAILSVDWPILLCCNFSLCNRDTIPTIPPSRLEINMGAASGNNMAAQETLPLSKTEGSEGVIKIDSSVPSGRSPKLGKISPVYIAVLVIGICSLIVIGGVAVFVLRRHDTTFGKIRPHGYLKGHHQVPLNDPELTLPLPRATSGSYDNRLSGKT